MITFNEKALIVNDKKVYPFGAEIHYFRVPKKEWQLSIQKARDAGMNMISTYIPWSFHEYKEGYFDFTGKTKDERDLENFLTLVQEANMYCLVRPGPYNMAELVDHGLPTWLLDTYPEIIAKDIQGKPHGTRVVSYNHPLYLERVRKWYQKVNEVIKDKQNAQPVIAYQLDNEVGMFHWVTQQGDFNFVVWHAFLQYAEQYLSQSQYHLLASVTDEDMYQRLSEVMEHPEIELCYQKFMRHYFYEYLFTLQQMAIEDGICVPFVVNIHGFHEIDVLSRGSMYPVGISQLQKVNQLKNTLIAGDYYIGNIHYDNYTDIVLANALTESVQSKRQPLFSAEFQGGKAKDVPRLQPSTFDLTTKLCLSNGMNAVNYYMFQSGTNSKEYGLLGERHEWQAPVMLGGKTRPHYQTISTLGCLIESFQQQLLMSYQHTDTTIGFYPDYYGVNYKGSKNRTFFETFQKDLNQYFYNGLAKGLCYNNISFNAVNVEENEIDPDQTPTLWMLSLKRMAEDVQEKLRHYVDKGGQLLLYPQVPEENLVGEPCDILKQALKIDQIKETIDFVELGEITSIECDRIEYYTTSGEPFAKTNKGYTCGFSQVHGNGKIFVLGAHITLNFNYKKDVFLTLAKLAGIRPFVEATQDINASVRQLNTGGYFIHLHNFDHYDKYPEIKINERAIYQEGCIKVPALKGLVLPYNLSIDDHMKIVSTTAEITEVKKGHRVKTIVVDRKLSEETIVMELTYGKVLLDEGMSVKQEGQLVTITLSKTFNSRTELSIQW